MGTHATVVITKTGYFFLFYNLFFSLVEIASILCCFKGGIMEEIVLKNLVIFIVALTIAGTLVSTGYYFAVQLSGKTTTQVLKIPQNVGHTDLVYTRQCVRVGRSLTQWHELWRVD
jgi:hypothetical protein